ncbi:MAG: hypothetical protein LBH81_00300 [Rickettsiales bacterium]|jgi:hypothetical protein|nr:hypothetical protein [Rickettsiales bacterium]
MYKYSWKEIAVLASIVSASTAVSAFIVRHFDQVALALSQPVARIGETIPSGKVSAAVIALAFAMPAASLLWGVGRNIVEKISNHFEYNPR